MIYYILITIYLMIGSYLLGKYFGENEVKFKKNKFKVVFGLTLYILITPLIDLICYVHDKIKNYENNKNTEKLS